MPAQPPSRHSRAARPFVLAGSALLAVGALIGVRSALFMATSVGTSGTVVAFVSQPTDHHAFRVRYDAGGHAYEILTHSYRGELSRGNTEFVEGQTLPVRYRKDAPADGRVFEVREQLGPAALFALPGLGLLLYGLFPEGATAGPLAKAGPARRRR
ncbi:MAG: DUF3592 domain-containing protein [Vicinamibacterales bacterium]